MEIPNKFQTDKYTYYAVSKGTYDMSITHYKYLHFSYKDAAIISRKEYERAYKLLIIS